MKWKIVTDSGADIRSIKHLSNEIDFEVVPLMLNIGEEVFIDTPSIDIDRFMDAMEAEAEASSSACPGPSVYADAFRGAENVICFTLSSGLSGSYNSACLGRDLLLEENPDLNVHVFDSRSAGGEIDLLIYKAVELIQSSLSFEETLEKLTTYHSATTVSFLLDSVDNLVKNGRVNKLLGQMIGLLGIKLVGKRSLEGTIELAHKAKGTKRAMKLMFQEMQNQGYKGGRVVIAHVLNQQTAENYSKVISAAFPQAEIIIEACSALCSYYAQRKGLIVGYETK